jgi:hypothetical protein
MSNVVRLDTASRPRPEKEQCPKGPAEILFFTGVRRERHDDAPAPACGRFA